MYVGLLLLCLAVTVSSQYVCPQEWVEYDQRCYKFVFFPPEIYLDAALNCQQTGATLLSIEERAENDFVVSWLANNDMSKSIWYTSGVVSENTLSGFLWEATGRLVDPDPNQQYWLHHQSRNGEGDFIVYSFSGTYGWTRADGETERGYICEIAKPESYRINQQHRDFSYGLEVFDPNEVPQGPKFFVNPVDTVILGYTSSVFLECVAVGFPQPVYSWKRNSSQELITSTTDDRYTLTNGRLTIQMPEDAYDSSDYQCIAENPFGTILSPPVQLSFATLGEFSNVDTAPVRPEEFEGAVIECPDIPTRSILAVRYKWMKNQDEFIRPELNDYIFVSTNGKIYFSEVTRSDEGFYYCVATLTSPEGNDNYVGASQTPSRTSRPIQLAVIGQPGSLYDPRIQDSFINVFPGQPLVGDTITMECFAYGTGPLIYSWSSDKRMDQRYSFSDHNRVLTIKDVRLEDATVFTCRVDSRRTHTWDIKTLSLRVEAKPYFTLPLRDQHIDIGNQLTWSCEARGIPAPLYTWYKNGVMLENATDGHVLVIGNTVYLMNLMEDRDSGMYQCRANNTRGVTFSAAQLRVLSIKPSFVKNPLPPRMTATVGGNVTIPCSPEAAPLRTINWMKDGGNLNVRVDDAVSRIRLLPGSADLYMSELNMGDAGTYSCSIENDLGSAQSSTLLTILTRTQISLAPSPTTVNVNKTAVFYCTASFNSQLDMVYTWLLNGHEIDVDKSPYYARGTGDLKGGIYIRFAQYKLEGDYTCVAMTQIDSDSRTARLTVTGPPGEPAGVYRDVNDQSLVDPRAVRIKWTDGPIHGAPITYYRIEGMTNYTNKWQTIMSEIRFEDTAMLGDNDKRTALLQNLKPGTGYKLRVLAVNQYGVGEPSIPTEFIVINGDVPERPPANVNGGNGSVGALRMIWDALPEEDHCGYGIGYKVEWRKTPVGNAFSKWEMVYLKGNVSEYTTTVGQVNYYSQYDVRVTPFNIYGEGQVSPISTVYSAEDLPVGTPVDIYAEALNSTAMTVTWSAVPDTRETMKGRLKGYKINYWLMEGEVEIQAVQAIYEGQMSEAVIIGLLANDWYTINVQVYNSAGNGPKSEDFHQETFRNPPQLYPTEVYVHSHGPDSVRVTFRGVSTQVFEEPLLYYVIRYYRSSEDIRQATDVDVGKASEGIIRNITRDVLYKLRVLGRSRGGDGKMSSPATLFTLAGGYIPFDPATSMLVAGSSKITCSISILTISLVGTVFWMS